MKRGVLLLSLLLSAAGAAQPYVRTHVPDTDLCLFWPNRKLVYTPNSVGSAKTPGTTEFAAIDLSFQTWTGIASTCSDFVFQSGGTTTQALVEYRQGANDNKNIIMWRETSCNDVVNAADPCWNDRSCGNKYGCWSHGDSTIALTTTTFSFRTGYIYDADIELNASPHGGTSDAFLFTTVSSPPCPTNALSTSCVATDVQNTLTHEIGHAIGLDHTPDVGSTMEATSPIGETKKRVLDPGTASGFCNIYPSGAPTPPCDSTGVVVRKIVGETTGAGSACGCESGTGLGVFAALLAVLRLRRARSR